MAETKLSTTWIIENYVVKSVVADGNGRVSIESGKMAELEHKSLPGVKWDFILMPRDPTEETAKVGFVGFYVYASFAKCDPPIRSLFAEWKVTLLAEDGSELAAYPFDLHEFIPFKDNHPRFDKNEDNWGEEDVFTEDTIAGAVHTDGSLSIRLDLTVINIKEIVKCRKLLQKLHDNKRFADLRVKVGDQTFAVHKNILAESSSVFAAMLENPTENGEEGAAAITEVVLNDTNPVAFEALRGAIHYDNWDFLADLDVTRDVLYLAEKYKLPDLKKFCDAALAEKVTAENALVILTGCAALYDAPKTIATCAEFLIGDRDFKDCEAWLDFKKDHEEIATAAYDVMVKRYQEWAMRKIAEQSPRKPKRKRRKT